MYLADDNENASMIWFGGYSRDFIQTFVGDTS